MNICENCKKEFEQAEDINSIHFCSKKCKLSFIGKKSAESRLKNKSYNYPGNSLKLRKRSPFGTWKCPHCNFIGETRAKLKEHQHKEHSEFIKCGPWNKGLSKFTNDSILRGSLKLSKTMKEKIDKSKTPFSTQFWIEEKRREKSEEKKQLYKEHPEKHPNRKLANNHCKISYPERVAYFWLSDHGIKFEHQKQFDKYFVDFYISDKGFAIEIDGKYWHNRENDKERDKIIKNKYNIDIIRISASDNISDKLTQIFN